MPKKKLMIIISDLCKKNLKKDRYLSFLKKLKWKKSSNHIFSQVFYFQ